MENKNFKEHVETGNFERKSIIIFIKIGIFVVVVIELEMIRKKRGE